MNRRPPILPRAAVRLLVPAERLEEIEGDLNELFQARLEESGARHARVRYWHDAATVIGQVRGTRIVEWRRRRLSRYPRNGVRRSFREGAHTMLSGTFNELKHAVRVLVRQPAYAAVAILTLALGIGANVAIFTVLNAVLLRPLPYPDPDRIISIRHHAPGMNMPELESSPGLLVQYQQRARTVAAIAGYRSQYLNLADRGTPERVRAATVSPGLFDVLATRPAIGRAFQPADALKHGPRVTILSHGLWQSRFGGEPSVIGRTILVDGNATEIIGVMPRGFLFPDPETRLLVPLLLDPDSGFAAFGMRSIARVTPGATLDAARAEIHQLQQQIPEWFPGMTHEVLADFGWSVTIERFQDRVVADVAHMLWILFGTVGFVLLIAGTNVVNLFLVRAESRQRELAVRSALGAGVGRIAATFLAESLLLAALGGAAGLVLAAWGTRLLVANGPAYLPRLHEARIDPTVFAFAAALTLSAALVLGLLPALSIGRRSFTSLPRDGGRGNTAGTARHRLRRILIVAQVATAVVLLVASGLMIRSVMRLSAVDPGFRTDGVVTAGVSLGAQPERARAVTFYHRVLDEIARVPAVESAGAASALPVAPSGLNGSSFSIRGRPRRDGEVPTFTMYTAVTNGFFETLGVAVLAGRAPERVDSLQDRPVAWVNNVFAQRFLDGQAVGEWIEIQDRWLEIVGVVGDLRTFGLQEELRPMAYLPLSNTAVDLEVMHAVVRTSAGSGPLASSLRNAVDAVDPSVPLTTMRTMEEVVAGSIAQASFTMTLLAIAAGIAVVLGVVGLYGVISYIVTQRTAEIGIRLALGARPLEVVALVLRQGLAVAVAGVAVGLIAALAATRFMASLLFEVSAHDPVTFATVAVLLTLVSAAATYVPARRAAGIDPVRALRQEA